MSDIKTKDCPKCGKEFECRHDADCWCMNYRINPENLELLKQTFNDCLCPDCLLSYTIDKRPRKCG